MKREESLGEVLRNADIQRVEGRRAKKEIDVTIKKVRGEAAENPEAEGKENFTSWRRQEQVCQIVQRKRKTRKVACGVQKVYGDFKVVDLVTLQFLNFWGQVFFFFLKEQIDLAIEENVSLFSSGLTEATKEEAPTNLIKNMNVMRAWERKSPRGKAFTLKGRGLELGVV